MSHFTSSWPVVFSSLPLFQDGCIIRQRTSQRSTQFFYRKYHDSFTEHACGLDAVTARAHDVEENIRPRAKNFKDASLYICNCNRVSTRNCGDAHSKRDESKLSKRRRKHLPRIPANIEDIVTPQKRNDIPGGSAVRKRFFQERKLSFME